MEHRIAFLVNSLNPTSGPGDATRLYAKECVRRGYRVALISVNDPHVEEVTQCDSPEQSILRLPDAFTWKQREARLASFIREFSPTLTSMRFICYGFHPKGIPWGVEKYLHCAFSNGIKNIMLDELWIGKYNFSSTKDILIGALQRQAILRMLNKLAFDVVHTNTMSHRAVLREFGVESRFLPLIGNIPIVKTTADQWLYPELQKAGINICSDNRAEYWLFGFFGSIHLSQCAPTLPYTRAFLDLLVQIAHRYNKKIIILSAGKTNGGEVEWEREVKRAHKDFRFLQLGLRSTQEISEFFNSIDFGLTTHPYVHVARSGSAASMLEHGLPLIAIRDDLKMRGIEEEPNFSGGHVMRVSDELIEEIGQAPRLKAESRIQRAVTQFLEDCGVMSPQISSSKSNNQMA